MHKYFPKGSEANSSNKSQASDNIWSDPEGFKKAVKKFEITSAKLIKISQNKNIDDTVSSFREVALLVKVVINNLEINYLRLYERHSIFRTT